MDGNDIYNAILAPQQDSQLSQVRTALAELEEHSLLLSESEREFVTSLATRLDLGHGLVPSLVQNLGVILKNLRQRRTKADGFGG